MAGDIIRVPGATGTVGRETTRVPLADTLIAGIRRTLARIAKPKQVVILDRSLAVREVYAPVGILVPLALAFGSTFVLTGAVRRYSLRRGVLDVPNKRSSHTVPTPRGGGAGFVIIFLTFLLIGAGSGHIGLNIVTILLIGGAATALVGWLDDRWGLTPSSRALVHVLVAGGTVLTLGGFPALHLGIHTLRLGFLGSVLATIGVVWAINLYNFMDGIDGIAASEGVIVGLTGGTLLALAGDWELAGICWLLASCLAGFLLWNWAPAKIFMGDVGSGFLGYIFGAIATAAENRGSLPLVVWVILLAVFIIDATATLVRRATNGERWYAPHRSHAYQRAVQSGYSHSQVTSAVVVLDLILAWVTIPAWRWPVLLLPTLLVVSSALFLVWRRFSSLPPTGLSGDHVQS